VKKVLTEQQIQECDRAIAAVAQGDTQALAAVYDCMARDIFVAVLAITQNHADAEDALQDTMLQIVKYAFSYRRGSNPRAWILTIARHRALDIVRRRKKTVLLDEVTESCASVSPAESDAFTLLEALDANERLLLLLRLYEELTYAEIAKIMRISTYAAQKRYQRILQKLKNQTEK
jgi:RNA polymerase sigma-70 factor (ECF subfamily)